MTSTITIEIKDAGGVDTDWMFPGLAALTPGGTSLTGSTVGEVQYTIGEKYFELVGEGTGMSQGIGLDVKGRVTKLTLGDGDATLIDVQLALDNLVLSNYSGCPVNSLLSLTPNSLVNGISGISDIEFNFLGNTGDDRLNGSGYTDFLDGKAGKDNLTGNGGTDTFYFGFVGKSNRDLVVDFDRSEDVLAIDGNVLGGILPKNLQRAFHDITGKGFAAEDANDRLLYDRHSGKLWYDADGNKARGDGPELVAVFDNHARIEAADFQVFL